MPLSRALLLITTAAGTLSVLGALFSDGQLAAQARWALAAGIGILAVGTALQLYWYHEPAEDFGWFAYGPLEESGAPEGLLHLWRQSVNRVQTDAFLHLLAVLCFAVGVFALPAWRRPRRAALTTVLALVLLAFVGSRFDGSAVLDGLGTVWPALLATLVAVGLVVLAGRRADRTWFVAAGTLLVAVTAATVFDDLSSTWSVWWRYSHPEENTVFLSTAVSIAADSSPEVFSAVEAAAELAGPALLTIGALRATRHTAVDTAA